MKKQISPFLSLSLLLLCASNRTFAQSTTFAYEGRLTQAGTPVTGTFDMRFKLFDSANAGAGAPKGDEITNATVPVKDGLFTVTLDFDASVFDGSPRFLEIGVRPAGNAIAYSILAPRQQVASIPYAIQSLNAATATTASNVASGAVVKSLNNLKDNVTLAAGPNVTITPSGNTLTIGSTGTGGGSGLWNLNGTDAYYNAGNVGLGTSMPAHRLSIGNNLPAWTANGWGGAIELWNSAAIGWQANASGQRFGMGHTSAGFFMFRTASDPGTTGSPAITDFVVDNSGNVGIGTPTPTAGVRLDVTGATRLNTGGSGGVVSFAAPNGESGMTISGNGSNRGDVRFDGSSLKLVANSGGGPPPAENGVVVSTAGNVSIGVPPANLDPNIKLEVRSANGFAVFGRSGFEGIHGESSSASAAAVAGFNLSSGPGVYGKSTTGSAIHADGNATQSRDKGGFAKAMLYVSSGGVAGSGGILRCYNGVTGSSTGDCGFKVNHPSGGIYQITFPFPVRDRFVSVTAEYRGGTGSLNPSPHRGVNFEFEPDFPDTVLTVWTFADGEETDTHESRFMVIVF